MLIDEIAHAVLKKKHSFPPNIEPRLAVYMAAGHYAKCMVEMKGETSRAGAEFYNVGTVHGFPTFRVIRGPYTGRIPDYVIVIVDLEAKL